MHVFLGVNKIVTNLIHHYNEQLTSLLTRVIFMRNGECDVAVRSDINTSRQAR